MPESFSYLLPFLRKLESMELTNDQVEHCKNLLYAAMPLFTKNQGLLQALLRADRLLENADVLDLLLQLIGTTRFTFHSYGSESYNDYLSKHDGEEEKAMRAKEAELLKIFNVCGLTTISMS